MSARREHPVKLCEPDPLVPASLVPFCRRERAQFHAGSENTRQAEPFQSPVRHEGSAWPEALASAANRSAPPSGSV
jgi:hypothetical protein